MGEGGSGRVIGAVGTSGSSAAVCCASSVSAFEVNGLVLSATVGVTKVVLSCAAAADSCCATSLLVLLTLRTVWLAVVPCETGEEAVAVRIEGEGAAVVSAEGSVVIGTVVAGAGLAGCGGGGGGADSRSIRRLLCFAERMRLFCSSSSVDAVTLSLLVPAAALFGGTGAVVMGFINGDGLTGAVCKQA